MQFKAPKNTEKYEWTRHAAYKMKQYGLTAQRILRVVKNPERVEGGIVKNTIAVMQPASTRFVRSPASPNQGESTRGGPASTRFKNGKRTWSSEIWAMYQLRDRGANSPLNSLRDSKRASKSQKSNPKQTPSLKSQKETDTRYQIQNTKYKIISAWRYPGVSPKRDPIPEDILRELAL